MTHATGGGWHGTCNADGMQRLWQDRTARHVAILVALKLCLLGGLWWAFVRDARLEPDAGQVAEVVLRAVPAADAFAPERAP